MTLTLTNNKPFEVSPQYTLSATGDYEPDKALEQVILNPMFTPLVQGANVTITDDNGNAKSEDDVKSLLLDCMQATYNAQAEHDAHDLMSQALVHFDKSKPSTFHELYLAQASARSKTCPWADGNIRYKISVDVIPACKGWLAQTSTYEELFCSLGFVFHPETLGFYFINEVAFDEFKQWFDMQMQQIAPKLSTDTLKVINDFKSFTLDSIVEGVVLRNNDSDSTEELSFARLLTTYLQLYLQNANPEHFGILPFHTGELLNPKTITFVNIERHAHATTTQIDTAWTSITQTIKMTTKPISLKRLSKLSSVTRSIQKARSNANRQSAYKQQGQVEKSAIVKFRKQPYKPVDMVNIVKKLLKKMHTINKSQNAFKSVKMSYARPNRRDPDNFNLKGKIVSTKYYPDIHLYIDTSGSISSENYESCIKACITLAKKLNVNLYFNSFSHNLSASSLLKTKDKSLSQIYKEFERIPKVTGGTEFSLVWDYIMQSKKRQKELSLLVTDFEYTAPNAYHIAHPKNLYYIPIATDNWDRIKYYATEFTESMFKIDPTIRRKIMM